MNPIFIVGITGRSGTHFIKQLLKKHPDISNSILTREDHFISELNYIDLYVKNVSYYWRRNEEEHEKFIISKFKQSIGKGITKFIPKEKNKKYVLLNTPYTHNLHLFNDFFPDEKLIIITRNAKDLVESGVRSKFWSYEEGLELWKRSAQRIVKFKKKNRNGFLLIKYEDLYTKTEYKLKEIFKFLDINHSVYPYDTIKNTPVQGSSDAVNKKKDWEYKNIKKTEDFKPLKRSENWNILKRWRFHWKCGTGSVNLGYETEQIQLKVVYFIFNILSDILLSPFKLKIFMKHKVIKYRAKNIE